MTMLQCLWEIARIFMHNEFQHPHKTTGLDYLAGVSGRVEDEEEGADTPAE